MRLIQERPNSDGVAQRIDALAILNFHRNPLFSYRQNKINLGFSRAFGKIGHVKVGNAGEKGPDNAFRQVPRYVC